MAGLGLVAIVIELALITPRALRLKKKVRLLTLLLDENLRLTKHEIETLQESQAETSALLRPYRRIARYLRSPLVVAFLESYRRRRKAGARSRAAAADGNRLAG
jgi:hypothetical protein